MDVTRDPGILALLALVRSQRVTLPALPPAHICADAMEGQE